MTACSHCPRTNTGTKSQKRNAPIKGNTGFPLCNKFLLQGTSTQIQFYNVLWMLVGYCYLASATPQEISSKDILIYAQLQPLSHGRTDWVRFYPIIYCSLWRGGCEQTWHPSTLYLIKTDGWRIHSPVWQIRWQYVNWQGVSLHLTAHSGWVQVHSV